MIGKAFKYWSDVAAISIQETAGTSDIEISFERFDHGDLYDFDGSGRSYRLYLDYFNCNNS